MLNRGPVALPFEEPPTRVGRGEVELGSTVGATLGNNVDRADYIAGSAALLDSVANSAIVTSSTFTKVKSFSLSAEGVVRVEFDFRTSMDHSFSSSVAYYEIRQGATVLESGSFDPAPSGTPGSSLVVIAVSEDVALVSLSDVDIFIRVTGPVSNNVLVQNAFIRVESPTGEDVTLD
jgi:hypothetical protein